MSDAERLTGYVETWAGCVSDIVDLLRSLPADDWSRPTDLPGWDVHDVVAHLAHLESELAGDGLHEVGTAQVGNAAQITADYTAQGPAARRDHSPAQLLDELELAVAARLSRLRAEPPVDGHAPASPSLGGLGWDWSTLLSNRIVDVWMHELDVRRAVGRPGGLSSRGATHTTGVFLRAFGYVVGKRVAPPPGTTVLLEVTGEQAAQLAVEVGPDGRAVPASTPPPQPTVSLRMDTGTYVALCGGRRSPQELTVSVEGDTGLAAQVLAALRITP